MTLQAVLSSSEGQGSPPPIASPRHRATRSATRRRIVPILLPPPPPPGLLPVSYHPQLHFPTPEPLSLPSTIRLLTTTLLLALSSIPICLTLNSATISSHPLSLFLASVLILASLLLILFLLWSSLPLSTSSSPSPSPPLFLPVFCMFVFSSFIDVLLSVSAHSLHPLTSFYLEHGEPYLSSAHGAAINLWDGTFHLCCYLLFIFSIARGLPYHLSSTVWAGSILNSMVVLLLGAVVGYGAHLKWSILLNVPYVVLPTLVACRRWQQRAVLTGPNASKPRPATVGSGMGGAAVSALTVGVHALRVCAALSALLSVGGVRRRTAVDSSSTALSRYAREVEPSILSPSSFPLLQHLLLLFASTPVLVALVPSLFPGRSEPPSPTLRWLALFHVGAVLQGHCTYLMQSLLPYTVKSHWVGKAGERWGMEWSEGLILTVVEIAVVLGNVWLTWRVMQLRPVPAAVANDKRSE